MTFSKSITTCFKKYFTTKGRASLSEYWWFQLLVSPPAICALIMQKTLAPIDNELLALSIITLLIITLLCLIPAVTVGVRRLHDVNRSGWYMLVGLMPYIGPFAMIILMLVFLIQPGTKGENKYGPAPLRNSSSH